jgi:hypothetical protein
MGVVEFVEFDESARWPIKSGKYRRRTGLFFRKTVSEIFDLDFPRVSRGFIFSRVRPHDAGKCNSEYFGLFVRHFRARACNREI